MKPHSIVLSLALAAVVSSAAAQAPSSFIVGYPANTSFPASGSPFSSTPLFGFGESSGLMLCRSPAGGGQPFGDLGFFDASSGQPIFRPFVAGTVTTNSVRNVVWERSGSTTPSRAFMALNAPNGAPGSFPSSAIVRASTTAFGLTTLAVLGGTGGAGEWSLDAVRETSDQFFLRRGGNPFLGEEVWRVGPGGTPNRISPTNSRAFGPVKLAPQQGSPSNQGVAYISGLSSVTHFLNPPGLQFGVAKVFNMPTGTRVSDLHWVDNRFLVCVISPSTVSGISGRIATIDTSLTPTNPLAIQFLTNDDPAIGSLNISGDRNWLTFVQRQVVTFGGSNTQEQSVAAMRIRPTNNGIGGGAIVLSPLQQWNSLTRLHIQSDPPFSTPQSVLDARIVFEGDPPGTAGPQFHRDTTSGDVSVTGRIDPTAGQTVDFQGVLDSQVLAVLASVGISFERSVTPGILLENYVLLGPYTVTGSFPQYTFTGTETLLPSASALNQRMFCQSLWLVTGPTGLEPVLGRVTELPLF